MDTQEEDGFSVGDSVRVRSDACCPDMPSVPIGGWRGRVFSVEPSQDDGLIVGVKWDSVTLGQLPDHFIRQSEIEDRDWTEMVLPAALLEPAVPRDIQEDVDRTVRRIAAQHAWDYLGEEGARIESVIGCLDASNRLDCLERWLEFLQGALDLPFEAEVQMEPLDAEKDRVHRVRVAGLDTVDPRFGLLATVEDGVSRFRCPLTELTPARPHSRNSRMIADYVDWFNTLP